MRESKLQKNLTLLPAVKSCTLAKVVFENGALQDKDRVIYWLDSVRQDTARVEGDEGKKERISRDYQLYVNEEDAEMFLHQRELKKVIDVAVGEALTPLDDQAMFAL